MKVRSLLVVGCLSLSLGATETTTVEARFVAHEWGTFTSVQGADRVQFEWNPFVAVELPKFVYDVRGPNGLPPGAVRPSVFLSGKVGLPSRQRMETPVIYFYSETARRVDVEVTFPNGNITEWYPQLAPWTAPPAPLESGSQRGGVRWAGVEVLPGNGSVEEGKFPREAEGSHYYAARATDASALRVTAVDQSLQYEKFLFYRGIGGFEAPLRVSHTGEEADRIRLENRGPLALGPCFIYAIRGGRAALLEVAPLTAGAAEAREFPFEAMAKPAATVRAELAEKLRGALARAGLFPREAAAMVQTWEDSWLGEPGLRVLYTLPQAWADGVLPLVISPPPTELKRVFVGRAEVITVAQEKALLQAAIRFRSGSPAERQAAVDAASASLGRFAEAGFRRLQRSGASEPEFAPAIAGLRDATRRDVTR